MNSRLKAIVSYLNLAAITLGGLAVLESLWLMNSLQLNPWLGSLVLALGWWEFRTGMLNRRLLNFETGDQPCSKALFFTANVGLLLILLPRVILLPLAILSLIFEKSLLSVASFVLFGLPSLLAPVLALYAAHGQGIPPAALPWHWPKLTFRQVMEQTGPFLGLLLVLGLFASSSEVRPYLFTGGNSKIILTQTVIVAIGALGMTMIIVSGGIDLSVGSVVAFTSVLGATLLLKGFSTGITIVLVALAAGLIGLINGSMIAGFRMMPFIVTLGMMGILRGSAKWLAGNQTVISPPDAPLNQIMALKNPTHLFPLPPGVWIAVGLALVVSFIMRRMIFGRYIFAIGANETTSQYSGIRVRRQKVLIYAFAGLFFGLAGVMQLSRLTLGDPTAAAGLELDIIAAVVIGGASLNGGSGSILGSMIGALIMAVLRNGSNQMGWQNYTQEIIIGIVIILAVGIDLLRQRRANHN